MKINRYVARFNEAAVDSMLSDHPISNCHILIGSYSDTIDRKHSKIDRISKWRRDGNIYVRAKKNIERVRRK